MSQSKSEDSWAQEAFSEGTNEEVPLTIEEFREIRKLRRRGFREIADEFFDYLQRAKKQGLSSTTLKEFCAKKDIKYPFPK